MKEYQHILNLRFVLSCFHARRSIQLSHCFQNIQVDVTHTKQHFTGLRNLNFNENQCIKMNLTYTVILLLSCLNCPAFVENAKKISTQRLRIEGPDSANSNEVTIFLCSLESQDNETFLEWRIDGQKYEGSQEIMLENDEKMTISNAVSVTFTKNKEMVNIICLVSGSGLEDHVQKKVKIKGTVDD